ncbi:MAG: hypothetical protein JWQ98_1585 [Chlorobi bacterium]|nr:hypothetical protein [Chlorobiota bacterium]
MKKRFTISPAIALAALICAHLSAAGQTLQNPILFVTQVPTPNDSAVVGSTFANHRGEMTAAPRGGDLWIRYPDGTSKNLTQTAGYGVASGLQGANAIAVREPSVHWNGTRALFSMVIGGPASQGAAAQYYWQIYEITGLGKTETPVITKVPNQPASYNNVSPIYGTDERIIFTSDRTRTGERHLYPGLDEYRQAPTVSGLWSLDPATGDLFQLDHDPSGAFSPIIDSYGRLLFVRWDHLQRDENADDDAVANGHFGTFNYSDESANAQELFGVRNESFPEPRAQRTDLLAGTNMQGFEFNIFIPWQINEDGTEAETINHLGRHELRQVFPHSITDDPQVMNFNAPTSGRTNQNSITNMVQVKEDPAHPGLYYGVDATQSGTHGGGELITLQGAPTLDPDKMTLSYITPKITANPTPPGGNPNPTHTGFFRNPVPTSDGKLLAVHSAETHADSNTGTRANPISRYTYRLKTLKLSGNYWVPDQNLTAGITKTLTYWDPNVLVSFSGTMWELDPVEVRAQTKPTRRVPQLDTPEQSVFSEEGVDPVKFQSYLRSRNLAVIVSRDVTHRDAADHQQPFYLKIPGTGTQSAGARGKIYDITDLKLYQGDMIRGMGKTSPTATPTPGRRVLAQALHDPAAVNPPNPNGPGGSVKLGNDGSMAAFVPARHAMTWALTDNGGNAVVRERYWLTFQPGEIRTCASCHGTNGSATAPINPTPMNKPEALRDLVRFWKTQALPAASTLVSPANDSSGVPVAGSLAWNSTALATGYRVQLSTSIDFATKLLDSGNVAAGTIAFSKLATGTRYYWRVLAGNDYGTGTWSQVWSFTTLVPPPAATTLISPANDSSGVALAYRLVWNSVAGATSYRVQMSKNADFSTSILDSAGVAGTMQTFTGLTANTRYYWRVRGSNAGGSAPWSDSWSFTTARALTPPAMIALISPADNATGIDQAIALTWTADPGATSYTIQISASADFSATMVDSTVSKASFALAGLAKGMRYYWRVQGSNAAGPGPRSATWSFQTQINVPPPAAIALASPRNNAAGVGVAPALSWAGISAATSYRAQVSSNSDFSTMTVDTSLAGTTLAVTGLEYRLASYYWRVRGSNAGGDGPWSDIWHFSTSAVDAADEITGAGFAFDVYPNPATPNGSVRLRLPAGGRISLKIYDALGNEVMTIVDGMMTAGDHLFTIGDLPGGAYFCRLHAGERTNTIALQVIR